MGNLCNSEKSTKYAHSENPCIVSIAYETNRKKDIVASSPWKFAYAQQRLG